MNTNRPEQSTMPIRVRAFDPKKAVEAVLFIASHALSPSYHKIAKLLYLADRLHLERYGRQICGDDYIAMEHGPVPTRIYNMLKAVAGRDESPWLDDAREAIEVVGRYGVRPLRAPNLEVLAPSDVECLKEAVRRHGRKSFGALTDLTHDKAWEAAEANGPILLESIIRDLPNADELLADFRA